jgi:hypothetical protein
MDFLAKETMVGVLPQPHQLQVYTFQYTMPLHVWFIGYFWGLMYLKSIFPNAGNVAKICPSIWAGSAVQLFKIN